MKRITNGRFFTFKEAAFVDWYDLRLSLPQFEISFNRADVDANLKSVVVDGQLQTGRSIRQP